MEDDDVYLKQLIYCIAGVLLFLIGSGWIKFSLITTIRRYFSPLQRQINDLQLELKQHRAEIAKIPIMDQFAANRKKQRIIDKLTDDLKELSKCIKLISFVLNLSLVKKRDKQEMTSNVVWTLFGKGACISLGLYLAGQSSDLSVLTMSSSHFYPFNFLLTYPNSSAKPEGLFTNHFAD